GGVVLALPLVSLGTYGVVASGVGLAVLRWAKIAENATDYSIMNTARQMLWLPTSREEKYKAKQAADTFVVRSGDMLSAGGGVRRRQALGGGGVRGDLGVRAGRARLRAREHRARRRLPAGRPPARPPLRIGLRPARVRAHPRPPLPRPRA